jgi:ankyrin repeat protein
VNAQDSRGRTALDWAVVGNQVDMVRRLARDGAMLGAGVSDGRCGLDYAAAIGNAKVFERMWEVRFCF